MTEEVLIEVANRHIKHLFGGNAYLKPGITLAGGPFFNSHAYYAMNEDIIFVSGIGINKEAALVHLILWLGIAYANRKATPLTWGPTE